MSLDLSSLKFSVDTSELDNAAKKIEALGTAVSALSVDLSKLNKSSSDVSKTQREAAKATSDAAKAEQELSKAKSTTTDSTKTATVSMDAATRAVEKQTLAMKIFRGEAVDLNDQVLTLGSSFTKGQSGQLANIKLLGATNDQMKELANSFADFNKITSANTFDNSSAGISKLTKDIFELTKVNDLMQRGIALTRDEIVNLVRDSERLSQQFKSEGLSSQQLLQALGGLEDQTIKLAKEKNELIARTHASEIAAKAEANAIEKSSNDAAKASQFLAREMQRVDSVITGFNDNLNITASNRLLKFREQLKASGVDAVTAEKMLKTYEERLKTINQVSQTKAKNSREEELKYLARATSVQLGDIGISLAGGQNPLLVLIQQGDQLRGVLNQVGASGNEMQKALSMAFGQIVNGSKEVVMALGSFVVGAFVDTGKAAINAVNNFTGLGNALESVRYKLTLARNEGVAYSGAMLSAFNVLGTAITAFAAVSIAGLIVGLAGLAIGYYKVIKENDELAKSLALTGGALSISQTTALSYVKTLGTMGVTTGDATTAIVEMAKAGNITSDSILMIGKAAVDMEKFAKVPIADTVKQFSELEKKPVEALIAIAKATGLVSPEVLRLVTEFDRQGKSSEAAAVAMKEYAKVTEQQIASMKSNYSEFSLFIIKAGDAISQFFSKAFKAVAIAANPLDAAADQMKELDDKIKETKDNMSSVDKLGFSFFKSDDSHLKKLEAERLSLSKFIKLQQEKNDAEEISKETNVQNAKAQEYINSLRDKNMSSEIKAQNELTELLQKKKKLLAEGNLSNAADLKIMDEAIKKQEKIIANANKPKKAPKLTEGQKGLEEYADIVNKANGLTASYNNELKKLQAARKDGYITEQQYIQAVEELIQQQPFYIKGLKGIADNEKALEKLIENKLKLEQELNKVKDENSKFLNKEQAEINKATESSKMKLELLGKTADEQFAITEQYRLQNQLAEIGLRYDERRTKLKSDFDKLSSMPDANVEKIKTEYAKALDSVNAQQVAAVDSAMQGSANAFEARYIEKILNISKTLSDAITTALFEGGQAGTKKLKDYIVASFRDQIEIKIKATISDTISGVLGGAFDNGSGKTTDIAGAASNLSTANSLYQASTGFSSSVNTLTSFFGAGTTAGASTGSLMYANAVGAAGGDALGALIASNGSWGGVSAIGGAAAATGATGAAAAGGSYLAGTASYTTGAAAAAGAPTAAALGPVGWAAIAAMVLFSMFGEKNWETKFGGSFDTSGPDGSIHKISGPGTGGEFDKNIAQLSLKATELGINATLAKLGSKAKVSYLSAGAESSKEGEAFANAGGKLSTGATFGQSSQSGGWMNRRGNMTKEQAQAAYAEELNQATLQALQAATDLPEIFTNKLKGVDIDKLTGESLLKFTEEVRKIITDADTLQKALSGLPFKNMTDLSYSASLGLLSAAGSLDAITKSTASYYNNFYTAEEKRKQVVKELTATLNAAGATLTEDIVGKATRTQFREAAESLDVSTAAGQKLFVAMMNASESFASITEPMDKLVDSQEELIKKEKELNDLRLAGQQELRDAFKKQIKDDYDLSVQTTTAAYNKLIEISQAEIKALEDRSAATDAALSAVETSIGLEKEKNNLIISNTEAQISTTKQQIESIKSIFSLLTTSIKELRSEVTATAEVQVQAARLLISNAIQTGTLPKQEDLSGAISAVRTNISNTSYATKADKDRAVLLFANELEQLSSATQPQLTAAEATLASQEQLLQQAKNNNDLLDTQLAQVKNMVNALRGIDTATKSVAASMQALTTAMQAESQAPSMIAAIQEQVKAATDSYESLRGLNAGITSLSAGINALVEAIKAEKTAQNANNIVNPTTQAKPAVTPFTPAEVENVKKIATERAKAAGTTPEAELYTYAKSMGYTDEMIDVKMGFPVGTTKSWSQQRTTAVQTGSQADIANIVAIATERAKAAGTSPEAEFVKHLKSIGWSASMGDKYMGWPEGTTNSWATANGIPAFVNGGSYQGGLALVGEEGPELINFNKPGQVYTNTQTQGLMQGDSTAVVQELQQLRSEVSLLRYEARASAVATTKINKNIETLIVPTNSGEALQIKSVV